MAEIKQMVHLNLLRNQLINAVLEKLASDPIATAADTGRVIYNTTTNSIKYYNGTAWVLLGDVSLTSSTAAITITELTPNVFTIDIANATTLVDGLMSAADKTKLDAATNLNTPSTIVMRDANGDFTANDITANKVTGLAAPVATTDAANKAYVDGIAAGLDPKESVRFGTLLDVAGTYSPTGGAGGTGAFTGINFFSTSIFDLAGNLVQVGDRILVKNQTTPQENGIYTVTVAGGSGSMERSSDMDGAPSAEVSGGNFTFVELGATLGGSGWVVIWDGVVTINTNPINWTQFSSTATIAGAGLDQTGNTIFVNAADNSLDVQANTLAVKRDAAGAVVVGANGISVNTDNDTVEINGSNQVAATTKMAKVGYQQFTLGDTSAIYNKNIVHNFGTTKVLVQTYDNATGQLIVTQVDIVDANTVNVAINAGLGDITINAHITGAVGVAIP